MRMYKSIHSRGIFSKGFTLVELLIAIAVIVIVVTVTFSISEKGLSRQQAAAKVKTEMALIAQALESYKLHHGDYPWINDQSGELYKALMGQRGPKGASDPGRGKPFIDSAQLTSETLKPLDGLTGPQTFIDPWGNPYHYFYKGEGPFDTWDTYGFILISAGPNGELGPVPSNGLIDEHYFFSRAGMDDRIQGMNAY